MTLADYVSVSESELAWAQIISANRPAALRDFDQIAMRDEDLVRQAKMIAPVLADRSVVFVGDHDGASIMSAVGVHPDVPPPRAITVVDFDERVLDSIATLSGKAGLNIETRLYNVFDRVPDDLVGKFDVFYTNPPYGKSNGGQSGVLFATRGDEMVSRQAGTGVIIIPDDPNRLWTREAMFAMQSTMIRYRWGVRMKVDLNHAYHLDDEPTLVSSTLVLERVHQSTPPHLFGLDLPPESMPSFYGQAVNPPYPRYILADGTRVPFNQ